MTQKQLSEKTGIPVSTLSGYFAKRPTPNAGAVQKIAHALNIRKSDIDPLYRAHTDQPKTADFADDYVIFNYQGKPLTKEDKDII